MIVIFTGLPGSGKSLKLASTCIDILYRNRNYWNKQAEQYVKAKEQGLEIEKPKPRILWTNLKMHPDVEQEFHGFIHYWADLRELTPLRDVDVVIDEVATYFDARLWETLSLEMRRWLAQHRKFGIEIYGTSQDFAQVDKAFRRLTSDLLYLTKLAGSRDISATKPPPRHIWGFVMVKTLDPQRYDEEKSKFVSMGWLPKIMWITREKTSVFDTRAEVRMSDALPLKHINKVCERPDCPFHKTVHV